MFSLKKLNTPIKIQNFIDEIPMNFEDDGETYLSPKLVLEQRRAHCMEGALLAAAALWEHGYEPLMMDLKVAHPDVDHVVAVYEINRLYGAISKTNHATVRFRDPIYRNARELALSYFHEYFLDDTGEKTLLSYSQFFNLKKFGRDWITTPDNLHWIAQAIDDSRHYRLFPESQGRFIRKADSMERWAGSLREWKSDRIRQ